MQRQVSLLVVLMVLGAGCLGSGDGTPAASAPPTPTVGTLITPDGVVLAPARMVAGEATDVTSWFNATFTADQAGRPVGGVPGVGDLGVVEPSNRMLFDITKDVPVGLPVRIFAELNAVMSQGDLDLWIQIPPGEGRTGNWNAPRGGTSSFELGMVHVSSESINVVVSYDELEPAQEVPFTLMVRVVADPELLVNGIVTGLTLPAEPRLAVELSGEKREREIFEQVSVMIFAPDDAFLGYFPLANEGPTTIDLPAGSEAGEYVLMLSQGGRNARVLVPNGTASMRALDDEFVMGETHVGDAAGHVQWTFELTRMPFLVGMIWRAPNAGTDLAFSLTNSAGPLVAESWGAGPFTSARFPDGTDLSDNWVWDTGYGAPGLTTGTYTAEVTFATAAGSDHVEALEYVAYYVR